MKSVKKFLNERMNSVDSADGVGGGGKKSSLERLKCGEDKDTPTKGYVSLPNTPLPMSAPIAMGDPSPSPSIADSAQNTPLCTLQEDDSTSPPPAGSGKNGHTQPEQSPFTFPAVASTSSSDPAPNPAPVQRKSRRKISLPWFRQSSVTGHGVLARQHTIDTPSSFRFFRQPSSSGLKVKIKELSNQRLSYIIRV